MASDELFHNLIFKFIHHETIIRLKPITSQDGIDESLKVCAKSRVTLRNFLRLKRPIVDRFRLFLN